MAAAQQYSSSTAIPIYISWIWGADRHPPKTPTFWEYWRNVIFGIVGAVVFAGCFFLLNTINDNRHLREEKQLLYNTIELLQQSK
ncbi:hypothetical protein [Muribaculum intestinale]|uniref:hypothetical protein n=1 Tax=Muribaculum intestinale TaxID=1796646 RepID=UPI0025A5550E|nr:hypothetical protein [Muribaculum intestinale]MCI8997437.1 hypothetical protein [Muribaculaceae bacterium]